MSSYIKVNKSKVNKTKLEVYLLCFLLFLYQTVCKKLLANKAPYCNLFVCLYVIVYPLIDYKNKYPINNNNIFLGLARIENLK